ncbi:MAG: flippase [bacterium]|nr:flippase [bacterium]
MAHESTALVLNTAISGLGRALGIAVTLVSTALITRSLGVEHFGAYSFILAFVSTFSVLADFGLGQLLTREISRSLPDAAGGSEATTAKAYVVGDIFILRLALLIVFLSAAPIAALFFPYPVPIVKGIILGSVSFLFLSLAQLFIGVFQRELAMHWVVSAELAGRVAQLGAVLGAYLAGARETVLFLEIFAGGAILQFLILLIGARRFVPMRLRLDTRRWWALAREAFPIGASLVFTYIYFRTDAIILSYYHPGEPVGYYNLAYRVLEHTIFFPAMFVGLVFPRLAALWPMDAVAFRGVFARTFKTILFGAPLTTAGLALFAPFIMRVLGGPGFEPAAAALRILSVAVFVIYLATLPGSTVVAMGIQKRAVWLYLSGALINVGLNFLFIPRYSFIAASWTTVVTEVIVTAGLYWLVWREMRR